MYNQLLYFRGLFDVDAKDLSGNDVASNGVVVKKKEEDAGDEKEKIKVVRELMRERFGTCKGVVEGYLKRCGRVWVQMDALFGFALK